MITMLVIIRKSRRKARSSTRNGLQKTDLFAQAKHAPLSWQPEACGGVSETWSYQDLIDRQGDRIDVTFATRDACPKSDLGETLTCTLRVAGGRIATESCETSRSDVAH